MGERLALNCMQRYGVVLQPDESICKENSGLSSENFGYEEDHAFISDCRKVGSKNWRRPQPPFGII
jgi:hypothetical protein